MSSNLSPIAETARLEAATETLAEYSGYLSSQIFAEKKMASPNVERIEALEYERQTIVKERREITPDNIALINRALYVYAPILKAMYGIG